jgi:hypothetical protein
MRAKDDPTNGGYRGFADVQSFFDEQRAKHKKTCESPDNEICQMRLVDVELFPDHGGDSREVNQFLW